MVRSNEICRLDYFSGTLATAYKGVITSLTAKDFCIIEADGLIELKGTIIALPEGHYETHLMYEGTDLAHAVIESGTFTLTAKDSILRDAKNLQIDVIQNGRHIGTFLLKRERPEGSYISAIELSDDLRDFYVRPLTVLLENRPGLLKRAETIIALIYSSKKDWVKLSEEINSFSKDLFWTDSTAFAAWYATFVKWSAKACIMVTSKSKGRAVSNVLALIELLLNSGAQVAERGPLVDLWLAEVQGYGIDLASRLKQSTDILESIHDNFPAADIAPLVGNLVNAFKKRVAGASVFGEIHLTAINNVAAGDDLFLLSTHSEQSRAEIISRLESLNKPFGNGDYAGIFQKIRETGTFFLNDQEMVDLFYSILDKNARKKSGAVLADAACSFFSVFPNLSADALKIALTNTGWLIRKMIGMKEDDAVESILSEAEKYEAEIRENILFNNEVALPIMTSGNMGLIQHYRALLEQLYVPSPNATGFSNDTWAEIVNPQHLRRLSKFLSILGLGGPVSGDLIIHLLANLYVGGVHIPDDRLFQREVSAYLNSGAIKSNFLFNNLLLKKLPVYFNEVGATSAIRDDTTEIDAWSNDPVLYFLRKQIHVNSSNYNVRMVEEIIKAWVFNDQHFLKNVVPDDVYKSVDAQLLSRYSGAIKTLFLSLTVLDNKGLHLERLLSIADSELQKGLGNMQLADEVRIKITLICRIYRAIVRKYELVSSIDTKKDMVFQLAECCVKLRGLKETLLSPETSVPLEALYFKRHIAFGIPSVLGTYHEARFDALGEIFRTENRMTVLFEEIISMAGETPDTFTSKEYEGWIGCLEVMNSMLHFHAISNLQIDEVLTILKNDSLHFSQIIDLLKIWQKEMIWIVASLTRVIYDRVVHLLTVFPRIERVEILAHLDVEDPDYSTKAADIIIRDILSSITGLTEMDRFIDILIRTIGSRPDAGDDSFFSLPEKPSPEKEADFYVLARMPVREAMRLGPVIGSKAKNLVYLLNHNISVPAGIIFPARQKPRSSDSIESSDFPSLLKRAVKAVESVTGQLFGDAKKPLFLSVRSGSYMSMPGILATILYCGMNNEICGALASDIKKARFAWDSYRRFIEDYATAVFGLDEKIFTDILSGLMSEKAVTAMDGLTDEHLQLIVERYIGALSRLGLTIPQDVYEQLSESVKAIYASWYGEKSVQYRKAMGISGYWGTAVLMMQMVSGNQKGSGASVFFTRRPFSHEKGIYGDTREAATGDDLVRGRFISRPLAKMQESGSDESLETVDPGLFAMHAHLAEEIENAMGGLPQEVEITYTTGPGNRRTIDTLQTKRMEFQPGTIRTFEEICMMDSRKIGSGIGVYGGALSGIASFSDSRDELQEVRRKTGLPLILLRKFSSTEDVSLMPYVDGIITAAGGATSHAAILAQKFGLTAVVGCFDMKIDFDKDSRFFAKIGNTIVKEGGFISIDGYSGHVYSGICGDKQRGPINKSGDR